MKLAVIPIVIGAHGTIPKWMVKRGERLGYKRTNGDHPYKSIIKIGQHTENRPGDLRKRCQSHPSGKLSNTISVKSSQMRSNNNNRISENVKNIRQSHKKFCKGDQRRFALTQTPVGEPHLDLEWNTRIGKQQQQQQ